MRHKFFNQCHTTLLVVLLKNSSCTKGQLSSPRKLTKMPTDLPLEERPQAHLRQTGYEQGEIGRLGAGVRLQQEVGICVGAFFRFGQL